MFDGIKKWTPWQKFSLVALILIVLYWSGWIWHTGSERHLNGKESIWESMFFDLGGDSDELRLEPVSTPAGRP